MPKKNAYTYYVYDYIKEVKDKTGVAVRFSDGFREASDSWNALVESEKAYYKEKANGTGTSQAGSSSASQRGSCDIKSSQGVFLSDIERCQREKAMKVEKMKKRIMKILEHYPIMSDFDSFPLFFMYGQYFYSNDQGEFAPAEIAIVRFTFKHGIIQRFHSFVAPEKVEIKFGWTAVERSQRVHKLPVPPKAMGRKDFHEIYDDIIGFISDKTYRVDTGNPIVFTDADFDDELDSQVLVLESFMKQFSGRSNKIDIYPINHLFYALTKQLAARNRCEDIRNENCVRVMLSYDPYDANGKICCKYHDDMDAPQNCALGRVTRLSYILSDHFCNPLGVDLIAGKHLPPDTDVTQVKRTFSAETLDVNSQLEQCSSRMSQISFQTFDSSVASGKH